jgi:hypothetical protein
MIDSHNTPVGTSAAAVNSRSQQATAIDLVRPQALVIGRVSRDPAPSRMLVRIHKGEHHDLLCRTRRLTANGQHLRY